MTKVSYSDTNDTDCVSDKTLEKGTKNKTKVPAVSITIDSANCAPDNVDIVTTEYLALVGEGDRPSRESKEQSEDDTKSVTGSLANSVTGSTDSTESTKPQFLRLL